MKNNYVLKTFAICCCAFLLVYTGFIATNFWQGPNNNQNQNKKNQTNFVYKKTSYLNPTQNPNNISHVTRVEIVIKDDIKSPDGKLLEAKLNDDLLTLKPATPQGNRGSTFLQLRPGTYTITWIVKNNPYAWPRTTKYTKQLQIGSNDLWIQVVIEGNMITVS